MKLHTVTDLLLLGSLTGILDHRRTNVYTYQCCQIGVGFGCLDKPVASATSNIKNLRPARRVLLLRQHATHAECKQLILKHDALHLVLIGAILNKIGTVMVFFL